jgi:anti-sigma regulatory factor (Ser/Thr protein kinase)
VRDAVRAFAGSAPQFDDIAMLIVRRAARTPEAPALAAEARLGLDGGTEELLRARTWLEGWCASQGVVAEAVHDLYLALEEVVVNVVRHGYGSSRGGRMDLGLALVGEVVRLEVRDGAVAFNPLDAEEPGPRSAVGGGGLGVHLVRRLMDRVDYARENGENHLILERSRSRCR